MKIVIANYCGSIGKTTIASHLLKPRMGDIPIFAVESVNSDASAHGLEVEKMRGNQFGGLSEKLMLIKDAIVDVGASHVEEFLELMMQFDGSHEDIDFFVVPVIKDPKAQAETVNTIRTLSNLGVPKEKIRLVFNQVQVHESINENFYALFGLERLEKSFIINVDAAIHANEIFPRMRSAGISLGQITADRTDYRAKMRASTDEHEQTACQRMISMQRLAVTANRNMDAVFATLFA